MSLEAIEKVRKKAPITVVRQPCSAALITRDFGRISIDRVPEACGDAATHAACVNECLALSVDPLGMAKALFDEPSPSGRVDVYLAEPALNPKKLSSWGE